MKNIVKLSNNSIQLLINYYNEYKCMPESVETLRHFKQSRVVSDYMETSTTIESFTNQQGEIDITIPEEKKLYTEEDLENAYVEGERFIISQTSRTIKGKTFKEWVNSKKK